MGHIRPKSFERAADAKIKTPAAPFVFRWRSNEILALIMWRGTNWKKTMTKKQGSGNSLCVYHNAFKAYSTYLLHNRRSPSVSSSWARREGRELRESVRAQAFLKRCYYILMAFNSLPQKPNHFTYILWLWTFKQLGSCPLHILFPLPVILGRCSSSSHLFTVACWPFRQQIFHLVV